MALSFVPPPATAQILTLSLHDALPISARIGARPAQPGIGRDRIRRGEKQCKKQRHFSIPVSARRRATRDRDRKSTRLNSSHPSISYAVFCLKKKNTTTTFMRIFSLLLP